MRHLEIIEINQVIAFITYINIRIPVLSCNLCIRIYSVNRLPATFCRNLHYFTALLHKIELFIKEQYIQIGLWHTARHARSLRGQEASKNS